MGGTAGGTTGSFGRQGKAENEAGWTTGTTKGTKGSEKARNLDGGGAGGVQADGHFRILKFFVLFVFFSVLRGYSARDSER